MFGTMKNDLEINVTNLRTQLTIFAEACGQAARLDAKQKHFIRKMILRKAERYQESFRSQPRWGHSLSSAIMANLQRRRIKRSRDLLPISANCCSYPERLDKKALDKEDHISLGLALFVQALLNGEVLDNKEISSGSFSGRYAEFFRQHILVGVHAPADMQSLTFLETLPLHEHSIMYGGSCDEWLYMA